MTPPRRPSRPGLLSVPFKAVPPAGPGSIAHIAHEVSRRLAEQGRWAVIGGTWERAPARESAEIAYHALASRWDRWCRDPIRGWSAAERGLHPYHRAGFRQGYARAAARRLRRHGCDLVLSLVFPQWLPVLRQALPRARILHWAQDMTFAAFPERFRHCFAAADGLVACSERVRSRMLEAWPGMADRSWVVPNGFDAEVFRPAEEGARPPDVRPTILYAGRITPEKGIGVLAQAFGHLAQSHPGVVLSLVGPAWRSDPRLLPPWDAPLVVREDQPGDLTAAWRARAGGAAPRMEFGGTLSRSALARAFRQATIVVQPSLWEEPFGMPALEAMACGAAVVVTAPGGHTEFVTDGDTGRVVPRGDAVALAEALAALLDDPKARRAMGQRAAAHVHGQYTWDQVALRMAQVLGDAEGADDR